MDIDKESEETKRQRQLNNEKNNNKNVPTNESKSGCSKCIIF